MKIYYQKLLASVFHFIYIYIHESFGPQLALLSVDVKVTQNIIQRKKNPTNYENRNGKTYFSSCNDSFT